MRSKTFSAADTNSLDGVVNAFLSARNAKAIISSSFFVVAGTLYLNLIYNEI